MKILFGILLSLGITVSGMATSNNADKVYQQLKADHHETFSLSLSKNMIDFFDMDLEFNGTEQLITGDFYEGKILVLEKLKSTKEILAAFTNHTYEFIETNDTEYKTEDSEAFLFVSRKGKTISEAHFVLVNDEKITILTVYGNIRIKNK